MTDRLLAGFQNRFRPKAYEGKKPVMSELVSYGQNPDYFIVSCADSRCDPGTIFDAQPGEFFGFKSIGAIVRPYKTGTALAASLQFAINALKVKKLLVIGHTHCGAIKALHDGTDDPEIASFIDVAHEAMDEARKTQNANDAINNDEESLLRLAEKQVLLTSAKNLMTYPSVKNAVEAGNLHIESWIFDMDEGDILRFDPKTSEFVIVTGD